MDEKENRVTLPHITPGSIKYHPLACNTEKLEARVKKLELLILLADPAVSGQIVNDVALKQWSEYVKWLRDQDKK